MKSDLPAHRLLRLLHLSLILVPKKTIRPKKPLAHYLVRATKAKKKSTAGKGAGGVSVRENHHFAEFYFTEVHTLSDSDAFMCFFGWMAWNLGAGDL